ncbi:MAG TPA: ABC transporter ATP-binding protein, partial [Desulfobacteraceae bacterium]|nr:ABC transporter ATP-binding protein [Desulfobacteraceae bacterium]
MNSTDIAIKVENISKRYRIGIKEDMHDSIGGAIFDFIKSPLKNYKKYRSLYKFDDNISDPNLKKSDNSSDILWALKDVSFNVKRGEVLGIIGRNGAGKSTLLKILSRITDPTSGSAEIRGKVSSLLEVGTGFHPELTGRENIYLNGTILGMRKREVEKKFDEIVDFSGISKFIDTPVKRYSSGMKVRLAFAVAAHLEPEILIIDEVLAVGDAEFQKKCLGKMQDHTQEGRTVLFVSHNMGAVIDLCPRSIILKNGQIVAKGPSKKMVEQYLSTLFIPVDNMNLRDVPARSGDGRLQFIAAYLQSPNGNRIYMPIAGHPVDIVLEYESRKNLENVQFLLTIFNQMGIAVTHCNVKTNGQAYNVPKGEGKMICHIPKLPFPVGNYKISIAASDSIGKLDAVPTACIFDIETSNFYKT